MGGGAKGVIATPRRPPPPAGPKTLTPAMFPLRTKRAFFCQICLSENVPAALIVYRRILCQYLRACKVWSLYSKPFLRYLGKTSQSQPL